MECYYSVLVSGSLWLKKREKHLPSCISAHKANLESFCFWTFAWVDDVATLFFLVAAAVYYIDFCLIVSQICSSHAVEHRPSSIFVIAIMYTLASSSYLYVFLVRHCIPYYIYVLLRII